MATQAVHADSGDLELALTVERQGVTITAHVTLTNRGQGAWEYVVGGDVPPPVQIAWRAGGEESFYPPAPSGITAHWQSMRTLDPGESLTQRAAFPAEGTIYLRALVTGAYGFSTDTLEISAEGQASPEA